MALRHEEYLKDLFLDTRNYFASSDLIKKLREEFTNCTPANARKIIQTSVKKDICKSSKPFTFGHNQFAYCSPEIDFNHIMIKNLFELNRPGIYRVISKMDENNGIISFYEAFKLSACQLKKSSSKITTSNQLIKILEDMDLAKKTSFKGVNYLIKPSFDIAEIYVQKYIFEYNNKQVIDCIFLPSFLIWLQKHNMVTTDPPLYRSKSNIGNGVVFNNLVWDGILFSKTTGLYDYISSSDESKKTIVTIDIKISDVYSNLELQGYYDRIQILRNSVKKDKRKVLPIILAKKLSKEARNKIKKLNFLYFDLSILFGSRINEIVDYFTNNPTSMLNSTPDSEYIDKINALLELLKNTGQEDNLSNLKGELFERIIFSLLYKLYVGTHKIQHSYDLRYTDEKTSKKYNYEYDYLVKSDDEAIIFELKGFKYNTKIELGEYDKSTDSYEKNTIKHFFNHTFLKLKQEIEKDTYTKRKISACYITTSHFTDEALAKLNMINNSKLKPKILDCFYDYESLINLLKKENLNKEINTINQYYS